MMGEEELVTTYDYSRRSFSDQGRIRNICLNLNDSGKHHPKQTDPGLWKNEDARDRNEAHQKHITVWQNELLTYGRPVICMEMNRCEC